MKKILLFFILFLPVASIAQPVKSNAITRYITTLKNDSLLRHASVSILVMDAKTKTIVASLNPDIALLPASTLKLVSTGLSIIALGADYKYHTSLAYDGIIKDSALFGNLYIIGGGDPTLGSGESIATPISTVFGEWANTLKAAGIKHITGSLIADETLFVHEEIPESWMWGDIGNYYGACVSGLSFCENAYAASLIPGRREGDSTTLRYIYPYMPGAVYTNKITTGKSGSKDNTVIYNSHYSNQHILTGTIPPKRDSVVVKGSNKDAAYSCIWQFNEYLRANGIDFTGNLCVLSEASVAPLVRITLAAHSSPTLREIAAVTNKKSNNFYAETLLKTLGHAKKKYSSYDSSFVVVNYLLDSLKVPRHGFQLRDGSGLSRKNYASAHFFCDYLTALYNSPHYQDFLYTLAVPGDKGTFQNLLANAPNKTRLRAKSGSMEGVRAYAGYSKNPNGTLVFAVIINNVNYKISLLQPKVEELLRLITEY